MTLRTWAQGSAYVRSSNGEFHLSPHYRGQLPLEPLLLKTNAALDQFVTEKYHDQIAGVLNQWSAALKSSKSSAMLEKFFAAGFSGTSVRPTKSRVVRAGPVVTAGENQFDSDLSLPKMEFLKVLEDEFSIFSTLLTAEFQITGIEVVPDGVKTRVRYELVGPTHENYREQRTGEWDIEWQADSKGEFRSRAWRAKHESVSSTRKPVFSDITEKALGRNTSYAAQLLKGADYWRTVLDGACGIDIYGHNGVSVGDIDDDGYDELYICQAAGLPNRLYRNRGYGEFEDITESAGVGILENTSCALFIDVDNDGKQDLIVVRTNGPLLFVNQGGSVFKPKPGAFHFANPPQGTFTGAAVADYDRDGYLDVYFCLYLYYQGTGQYKYPSPYYRAENGPPNFLMCNNRDGTFRDVTEESGLNKNNTRYSFCCSWNDYNQDGWPDLYVVNDFGAKNLYRNNGDGTFTDVATRAGVEDIGAGMSVSWMDYDNDGVEDLYVANMWTSAGLRVAEQDIFQKNSGGNVRELYRKHAMGNSLFRNKGDGTFQNASAPADVQMGRWSWSSDAWDFDHDGFLDLYVTNGMVSGPSRDDLNSFFWRQVVAHSPSEAKPEHEYEQGWTALNELIRSDGTWSGYERNVFYANNRDGSFSDVSGALGIDFLEDGRSLALADIDHDGRLEVIVKNRDAPQLRILKNIAENLSPSISFRLRGAKSNRDAIGAVVSLETPLGRQVRTLQAGSGFLSQHSKEIFFGLGGSKGEVRASIRWPSGLIQELRDLPPGHRIWVDEGSQPVRMEPHAIVTTVVDGKAQARVPVPATVETWLISPLAAPDFSLSNLSDGLTKLSDFRGKRILLYLWVAAAPSVVENLDQLQRAQSRWRRKRLQLLAVNFDDPALAGQLQATSREHSFTFPVLLGTDDVSGIYNILYRYLFDRHRDLALPTAFLIDADGQIAKVYQGSVDPVHVEADLEAIPKSAGDRLIKALPFPGIMDAGEFRRNYLSYGSIYFQRGYFEQSEASFQLALQDDPASAEALYGLGSVYLKQEKMAQARNAFERASKLGAAYPETLPNTWNNLGLIAAKEGRTDAAIANFQEALRLSPEYSIALVNLGNAYRQKHRWDEARQVLERALALNPEEAEANYSLGMVFAQAGDNERAYEYLQRALKYRPGYPEALNNLGVLYLRTQRRDQAVATFEDCIRLAPGFDQSYLNLASVYVIEGNNDKARGVLLELLKQHPGHPQAQKALAQLPQ